MFNNEDKKKMVMAAVIIGSALVAHQIIDNIPAVMTFLRRILGILNPIIIGFVMYYIVNIPMKSVERNLFKGNRLSAGLKRGLSLVITLVLFFLFLTVFFLFAVPQLVESIALLMNQIPGYALEFGTFLEQQFVNLNLSDEILNQIQAMWTDFIGGIANIMMSIVNSASGFVGSFISGIFTAIISTALAVYMLLGKERLSGLFGKLWNAYAPNSIRFITIKYIKLMDKSFEQFIRGQLMEALVLGIVCYIGMLILGFEYALLISFIVGITNIIPMFGPYIGAIPSFLLLLMVNPIHALWFIVYVTALQQIEANLIYPRVVGDAMGISGFWIMVAVIIGNSLFGIMGILVGIPLFSAFYIIMKEATEVQLKKRRENEEANQPPEGLLVNKNK